MKYITLFFCCLFYGMPIVAQQSEEDSLLQVIQQAPDSQRLATQIHLALFYRKYALEKSIRVLTEVIEGAREKKFYKLLKRAYSTMGITYGMKEDYATALTFFNESLKICRLIADSAGVANTYINFGIVYKNLDDYPVSINYYYKALMLFDSLNDLSGRSSVYSNIGVLHDLLGDAPKAMDAYRRGIEINRTLGQDTTHFLSNIALLYEKMNDYNRAESYHRSALNVHISQKDTLGIAVVLGNLAHLYQTRKHYAEAEIYALQALELNKKLKKKGGGYANLFVLCAIHLEQKHYPKAVRYAEDLLEAANLLNTPVQRASAEELAARCYAAAGNYRKAWLLMADYKVLNDSIFSQERNKNYQQWQTRLAVQEKDRQIKQQALEVSLLQSRIQQEQLQRNLLLGGLLMLGILLLVFLYINRLLQQKNNKIQEQRQQIEQVNMELEQRMLRAQINPHFLFNALGAIQHFITLGDKSAALRYLSRFSALLRQVLEQSIESRTLLKEEVQLLENYLALEALRFEHSFSYQLNVDASLDQFNLEVPILLIQPYVENAIMHGLLPKNGAGKLSISFENQEDFIICRISDNGIGRAAAAAINSHTANKRPGRGMEISKKRLQMLYETGQDANAFQITDLLSENGEPAGTEVVIRIPKMNHDTC
jgi:hypothetical protein